jgi:hypothetical protein
MNASNRRRPGSVIVLLIGLALGVPAADAATVTRGPYLQMGSPTQVVVRWRTDVPTDSRVSYGICFGENCLTGIDGHAVQTTEHEVTLLGLSPNTRYYYAVGTTTQILAGNDANHFFVTSPAIGEPKPTRIWVLGDSGTANSSAAAVRDAYYNFTGSRQTDLWLMLGDNAYSSGTDSEYQAAVFNMYPGMLRKSVLWATLGNHDGSSANSGTQSGPYYNIFSLPKNGEAGGMPSGTEAYYSFDYGNIHFVVLDSFDSDRSPNGAMMTWLRQDLAATTQDWLIAFWHHPPYSKGSHDSDSESALTDMRRNALPILEDHGVDLVLSGHSHSYERSFLLDGHYGTSSTLTSGMILDNGDGRETGNGAYQKPSLGPDPHRGAVYAVAGSSGKTSSGSLNHPVMVVSMSVLGSLVLDVDGNRLDATFLRSSGTVGDTFTIMKGSDSGNTPPTAAADSFVTNEDTSVGMAVLSNDVDADGDSLSVASVTQPGNGTVTINADNTVTYAPHANVNGSGTFSYTVSDGRGGRSTATVAVTVNPVNDVPVATDGAVTTQTNTALQILLTASDPDGNVLTNYAIVSPPVHGTLSGSGANRLYTPGTGWTGQDSFTFKVVDPDGLASNVATVAITVTSGPTITGFQSPTADAPVTSSAGDRNGFETNRTGAYADDGLFAVDNNSGSSSSTTSCTSSSKDKHVFYNYNFSIPTGSSIKGIEVRLDAKVESTSSSPKLCVQLSWNGGSSWTTTKSTARLTTSEATYVLGSATDLWGRGWTGGNFGNPSFRVRVISVASSTSRDFSLDWVAVRVTHQPAP